MSIYSKRANAEQRKWLKDYEDATGYEPLHQEDFDDGSMTFLEVAKSNVQWFENFFSDAMNTIPDLPEADAPLKESVR